MGKVCDFFFTGTAVLPPMILMAGEPAFAIMAMVVLCISGALCGIADPEAPHRRRRG